MKIMTVQINDETDEVSFTFDEEFSKQDHVFQSSVLAELYNELGLLWDAVYEQQPEEFKLKVHYICR